MKLDSIVAQVAQPVAAAAVKYEIFKAMERAAEFDAGNLSVEVHEGVVILRGQVRSGAERDDAGRAALNAPGVTYVQNQIRVVSSST